MTEGATGMENQCLGLAERMGMPIRVFRLSVKAPWRWIAPFTRGTPLAHLKRGSDLPTAPWPRLLIACGRQSIPFSIAIRGAAQGRTFTVQCQNPRVPTGSFDLIVPPEHDQLSGGNVFPILGSPNRVTDEKLAAAKTAFAERFSRIRGPRLAVLIGGPSKTYRFGETEATNLARTLRYLSRDYGLMITLSRRSGDSIRNAFLAELGASDAYIWDGEGENPYTGMLAWADALAVTADSVNMVCEAGATGRPVHILELPGGSPKFDRFYAELAMRGVTRRFRGVIEDWSYERLDETGRAVDKIRSLLDLSPASADISPPA